MLQSVDLLLWRGQYKPHSFRELLEITDFFLLLIPAVLIGVFALALVTGMKYCSPVFILLGYSIYNGSNWFEQQAAQSQRLIEIQEKDLAGKRQKVAQGFKGSFEPGNFNLIRLIPRRSE